MRKLSSKSQRLIDDAVSTEAIAYWQEDQGNGSEVDASRREADAAKIKLVRHIARLEARVGINIEDFTAFIGNGENSIGRFPANLTELHDALVEFEKR